MMSAALLALGRRPGVIRRGRSAIGFPPLQRQSGQATNLAVGVGLGDGAQLQNDLPPDCVTEAALTKHADGMLAHQDVGGGSAAQRLRGPRPGR